MKTKSLLATLALTISLNAAASDIAYSLAQRLGNITIDYILIRSISAVIDTSRQVLKHEIIAVQSDAIDFLAGDSASETLSSVINNVRELNTEFQELSDEDIAILIIEEIK